MSSIQLLRRSTKLSQSREDIKVKLNGEVIHAGGGSVFMVAYSAVIQMSDGIPSIDISSF